LVILDLLDESRAGSWVLQFAWTEGKADYEISMQHPADIQREINQRAMIYTNIIQAFMYFHQCWMRTVQGRRAWPFHQS
jgi:hypothetical protein